MKKESKLKKLDIDLFPESTSESEYTKVRSEYIADFEKYVPSTREYHSGGFLSPGYYTGEEGRYVKDPVQGEAGWNKQYPGGYKEWAGKQRSLNAYGEQKVIDKLNELITFVNKLPPNPTTT